MNKLLFLLLSINTALWFFVGRQLSTAEMPTVDIVALVESYNAKLAEKSELLAEEESYVDDLLDIVEKEKILTDECVGYLDEREKKQFWAFWEELDEEYE